MIKKLTILLICINILNLINAQAIDTLIDVGGHKLHFNITMGSGTPILFEAGNGDDGSVWQPILADIHKQINATLITYDRAGLGKSEIDTSRISILNEIKALEVGLKRLGYSKSIFVVSHSFGSYYSTLYVRRNREKVKGVVFIDVLTPCYFTKQRAKDTKESISKDDWVIIKKEAIGLYYVLKNLESIYEYTKDKQLPSNIPTTIIGADIPPPIVKENERDEWKTCLKSFGELPNHSYILAKNSGHKVWKDNPRLVMNEIIKLYRQVTKINDKRKPIRSL